MNDEFVFHSAFKHYILSSNNMSIRSQFILIGLLSFLAVLGFSSFVLYQSRNAAIVEQRNAVAQELILAVFARDAILNNALFSPNTVDPKRVLAQNAEVGDVLLEAFYVFDDPASAKALRQIQINYDEISFRLEHGSWVNGLNQFGVSNVQKAEEIFVRSASTVELASQVVSQSRAQLVHLREHAVRSVFLFGLIGLFLSGVALFIGFRSTSVLRRLEKEAMRFAQGDLTSKMTVKRSDEIGRLAQSFNTMAKKLGESRAALEQKIQARTQDLENALTMSEQQTKELEQSKSAVLNILEDLEEERNNTLKEKAKDEALLASIGEGIIFTDLDGMILLVNRAAEQMLGQTYADLHGGHYTKAINAKNENGKRISKKDFPVEKLLTTTTTTRIDDLLFTHKNGKSFPVVVTTSKVLLDDTPLGVVVVFRDVTQEKAIDIMKTEFISIASHQLRTPLTAIKLFNEMMMSGDVGPLNTKQKEYTQSVSDSTERMIKLVNDLLNVSRMETGRLKITTTPTDLIHFVRAVVTEVSAWAASKNCKIILKPSKEKFPLIPIDDTLFRQVIHNLLTNAIRYSGEKKCGILVNIEQVSSSAKRGTPAIRISIADSGIGIPKEAQERIFEKFFRADNAVKTEAEGSGLGLYLAKMIMETAGGKIWFESKSGEGTTFFVELPMGGMVSKKGEKGFAA